MATASPDVQTANPPFYLSREYWLGVNANALGTTFTTAYEASLSGPGSTSQGRIARVFVEVLKATTNASVGVVSVVNGSSTANALASTALITVVGLGFSLAKAPLVPAAIVTFGIAIALDAAISHFEIDIGNVDPNTVASEISQEIGDMVATGWNAVGNAIDAGISSTQDLLNVVQAAMADFVNGTNHLIDGFEAILDTLFDALQDSIIEAADFWTDLAGLFAGIVSVNATDRIPDWLSDVFDNPPVSPLVLDFDGDGVDLVDLADSSAFFDIDIDGFAERVAWIGADDGFLAFDRNGNGVVDDRSELFGGEEIDGFATLALEDADADGVIDALDPVFASLLIWRDLDGDGATDAPLAASGAGLANVARSCSSRLQCVDFGLLSAVAPCYPLKDVACFARV